MRGQLAIPTLVEATPHAPRAVGRRVGVPRWEWAFAVMGLFLCLDAGLRTVRLLSGTLEPIPPLDVNQIGDYVEGNGLTQGLLFAVYLVSVGLLLIRPVAPLRLAKGARLLWLLLGLAVVSILWSGSPEISFRRIVALLGSAVFGLYLGTRYSRVALLRVLLGVSVVAMAFSLLVCLALPAYGVDETGAWQGVFDHKNHLGSFMALAAAVWLLHAVRFRHYRPLALGLTAVSGVLVMLSQSATAVVILATLLAVLLLLWLWRLDFRLTLPILGSIAVAGGYAAITVATAPDGLLALLGKNATFTGRTPLWALVWEAIQTRFWFGYGYGGFWLGLDGPSAPIWFATGWNPPTAHNGFLDLMLDLGVVGFVVFILLLLGNLRRAWVLTRRERGFDAVFPLVFMVFLLVSNLTESYLVTYNTLSWVFYVAITIALYITWAARERARKRVVTGMNYLGMDRAMGANTLESS